MLKLPVHIPGACRLIRVGKLKLLGDGSLEGSVTETLFGRYAADARRAYRSAQGENLTKVLENFLGESLGNFVLTNGALKDLDGPDTLQIMYSFTARNYGKSTGPMLLLRPRVLGQKVLLLGEKKDRKHSVNLSSPSVQTDVFEI